MSHLRFWKSSIDSPEGSSGGRSHLNCTKRWNPKISDFSSVSCNNYVNPHSIIETETTHEVIISLQMSGDTALERFLGCLMISIMPAQGLEEALYSLRDMLEFYKKEPSRLQLTRGKPEPINATVVERRKRPDLIITP